MKRPRMRAVQSPVVPVALQPHRPLPAALYLVHDLDTAPYASASALFAFQTRRFARHCPPESLFRLTKPSDIRICAPRSAV